MELESSYLITIEPTYKFFHRFSYEDDTKVFFKYLRALLGLTNLFLILFLLIIFLINGLVLFVINFYKQFIKDNLKNLNIYQIAQNNFCDNFRYLINRDIENQISLFNITLYSINFDIFIYNYSLKNNIFEYQTACNILHALEFYSDKYDYEKDDILIINISENSEFYTNLFGIFNFSVLSFIPFEEDFYVANKNFCRNNKKFLRSDSTVTIINRAVYPDQILCNYYKDINNNHQSLIICDKSVEGNIDGNYIKIGNVRTIKLIDIISKVNKRLTLLILNMKLEGEMALESGKELVSKYHIPFIFIEFNLNIFKVHKRNAEHFLFFFIDNGYKISLNGFLNNEFINIIDLLNINFENINLYIVYDGK